MSTTGSTGKDGGGAGGGGDMKDRKRKESILDVSGYLDKNIRVKFAGGREVIGVLKGFDALLNLVLDDTLEFLRGKTKNLKATTHWRGASRNHRVRNSCLLCL